MPTTAFEEGGGRRDPRRASPRAGLGGPIRTWLEQGSAPAPGRSGHTSSAIKARLASSAGGWEHVARGGTLLRSGGWWGIAFVLGLFVDSVMVSLPTAAQSGERITAFYDANRQVIVVQQVVGILLLVPWLGFALTLDRRARAQRRARARWLLLVGLGLAAAELATNLLPLALAALADTSSATAHTLTLAEDLADAALFASIAVFASV